MAGEPTASDSGAGLAGELRRTSPPVLLAALGGLSGLLGYAALWGHAPLDVSRRFRATGTTHSPEA